MCTPDPSLRIRRLVPGQALHEALDAGTVVQVLQGRLRVEGPMQWLADRCVRVDCSLGEGERYGVTQSGWIGLQALGGEVVWRQWAPPEAAPMWRGLFALGRWLRA